MTHQQRMRPDDRSLRRLAFAASMASGLAWLAWEGVGRVWNGSTSATYCSTSADYLSDTAFAVATTSTAIALLFLAAMLRGRTRWLALAGGVGVAASGFGNAVEHCVAEPFFLMFVAGAITYTLTTAALAGLLLWSGDLSRWTGLFLGAAVLGLMMLGFDRGGAVVTGAAWLAVGVALALANNGRGLSQDKNRPRLPSPPRTAAP